MSQRTMKESLVSTSLTGFAAEKAMAEHGCNILMGPISAC